MTAWTETLVGVPLSRRWNFLLVLGALLLAAAAALSAAAHRAGPLPGDLQLTRELQQWRVLGPVAGPVRLASDVRLLIPAGLLTAAMLSLRARRWLALVVLLAALTMQPGQALLKDLVDRPRPPADLSDIRARGTSPSFPAGHVFSPTVAYGLAAYLAPRAGLPARARRATGAAATVVLALSGPVNVYLGVHWPSDVLGGYLWGGSLLLGLIALSEARSGAR